MAVAVRVPGAEGGWVLKLRHQAACSYRSESQLVKAGDCKFAVRRYTVK